jgi:flagellar motor component MotA
MIAKLIVSIVLILGIIVFGILVSGGILIAYYDLPTILVVVGTTFLILFASWPIRDIGRAFKAPFSKDASIIELKKSVVFFELARKALVWSGLLAVMMGVVAMLLALSLIDLPKDLERLGKNCAVALLSVFQVSVTVLLLVLPFESAARRRLIGAE